MNLESFGLVPFQTISAKIGDEFGLLTVLGIGRIAKTYRYFAICQCACGSPPKRIRIDGLTSGNVEGCGCVQIQRSKTHGLAKHPLYSRHRLIMERCYNPKDPAFENYGGRGISVCQRWHDVQRFIADLQPIFRSGLEIDRKNNDGNYEPNNVRFVTRQANADNRRNARRYTYDSETYSIAAWSKIKGLRYQVLWDRLTNLGWSIEKSLNTPTLPTGQRS